ncbi:DUF805 domain-containing protein [Novosphingobium guangzhouense]|uniref:DUF805 domain-containing protein n=1 Tax=Novosphingobium guangzhouense TaxID=1850347 RepID=A0A2K2G1I9_9SPHN|nr:DUF805 domain-containing protein [Novosphingobium guangzhouense]PNU04848.1 hypothetical protein A8V01_18200 [Novosphingobium guangzhouense]
MIAAIKCNLANLTNFKGREGRSAFWFYFLFLAIIQIAISVVMSIALTGPMMADVFSAAQQGLGEAEIQKRMFERLTGMMRTSVWLSVVTTVVLTGMLVASFTRRLHDSNKPGWIAGLTVVIQFAALGVAVSTIDKMAQVMLIAQSGDMAKLQEAQAGMMMNGALGYVPLLLIVVFGVWPSSDGANRYGEEPDHI